MFDQDLNLKIQFQFTNYSSENLITRGYLIDKENTTLYILYDHYSKNDHESRLVRCQIDSAGVNCNSDILVSTNQDNLQCFIVIDQNSNIFFTQYLNDSFVLYSFNGKVMSLNWKHQFGGTLVQSALNPVVSLSNNGNAVVVYNKKVRTSDDACLYLTVFNSSKKLLILFKNFNYFFNFKISFYY